MEPKAIELNGKPLAAARGPAVCAPLVARDQAQLEAEARAVAAKGPDLLEWRVDFFEALGDTAAVLRTAAAIRAAAPQLPLLFTRRSQREGGQPIALAETEVVALYRAVCSARAVEMVDFEMGNAAADVQAVRECSRAEGIALVLSYHNFNETPAVQELVERLRQAQRLGADVAKVAVMPRAPQDVLRLLEATAQASAELSIPVVSMSMGGWGSVSRLCGGVFGSAMTFAVGQSSSAPGQMPIEDVRAGLQMLARAMGNRVS